MSRTPISLERSHDQFHTTQWTQLRAMADGDCEHRRRAMNELIRRYWPPVYAHLRAKGRSGEEAAEQTQAFFAEVVIGRDLFEKADQVKGKLRTYMITALNRFCVDQHRRRQARGAGITIPLEGIQREEERLRSPPAEPAGSPSAADVSNRAFERRWALNLLEEALRRCEARFRGNGRAAYWELFEARVLLPQVRGQSPAPLADLAETFGFDTPAQAASAVHLVRQRSVAILREVVAETLDEDDDIDAELNLMREYLAG